MGIACLGLANIFPGIAYILMLINTTRESKSRFALWYLLGFGLGIVLYCVFNIFAGLILYAIIGPIVSLCILWYFYCCLQSYAEKVL